MTKMKTRKLKQKLAAAPAAPKTETPIPQSGGRPAGAEGERLVMAPETITEVAARMDVGLGNALFIRGQGGGLSWDQGVPLECKDASTWVWSSREAKGKLAFKLLLNDAVWAQGQDIVVEAGRRVEVVPGF
jgi:hypothetical protein